MIGLSKNKTNKKKYIVPKFPRLIESMRGFEKCSFKQNPRGF